MTDALDMIDRAILGVCPCGVDPAPGSAYCGDDCTPTHRSVDTSSDIDGTPMRWRPDLVTAVDDTDLIDLGSNTFYDGRLNAQLFQRGLEVDGTVTWHLRLDDGHRFVGADLEGVGVIDDGLKARVAEKWAALERELGNSRHLEPDPDPWVDAWGSVYGGLYERHYMGTEERERRFVAHLDGFAAGAIRAGQAVTYHFADEPPVAPPGRILIAPLHTDPTAPSRWTNLGELAEDGISHTTGWDNPNSNPLEDIRSFMGRSITASFPMSPEAIQSMRETFDGFSAPPPEPENPMLAAIQARRNRNTGPGQQQRAPRQINPRRGR